MLTPASKQPLPVTAENSKICVPAPWFHDALVRRVLLIIALLGTELVLVTIWKFTGPAQQVGTTFPLISGWKVWLLRFLVFFFSALAASVFAKARREIRELSVAVARFSISLPFLVFHFAALACFGLLPLLLVKSASPGTQEAYFVQGLRWSALIAALVFGTIAFVPLAIWLTAFRAAGGKVWFYALLIAAVINPLTGLAWSVGSFAASLTFSTVALLLKPFLPDIVTDPGTSDIGTQAFQVHIAPACSGLEGMALMIIFGSFWLWLFRKDYRFPHAFLLVPVAVVFVWVLNSVRIAALILIGNAGRPEIALSGFHSQAGWLAFIAVALSVWIGLGRARWVSAMQEVSAVPILAGQNPTAAYLLPFLLILGAAMFSRAVSGQTEWLYPLRFFAATAAIWFYHSAYTKWEWSFHWLAPLAGVIVFAIWLLIDWTYGNPANDELRQSLAAMSLPARFCWLAFRVLGAVVTVPLAEELAFRGFLARRLISSDFESVPYASLTMAPIVISSAIFGVLHGNRWLAGSLAGVIYALLVRRTGQLSDAIIAHATTNAIIAVSVLCYGNWQLW